MKLILIYITLCGFLFSCKTNSKEKVQIRQGNIDTISKAISTPFTFTLFDTGGHSIRPDQKLADAWQSFVKAIQAEDYLLVEKMSANCIACVSCETDSDGIPFKNFLKNYYRVRFNTNLKSRMSDSTKVKAHYYEAYMHIEPCIIKSGKKGLVKYVEFSVTIVDRTEDFEAGVAALAFIETPTGYKFWGYSTIP